MNSDWASACRRDPYGDYGYRRPFHRSPYYGRSPVRLVVEPLATFARNFDLASSWRRDPCGEGRSCPFGAPPTIGAARSVSGATVELPIIRCEGVPTSDCSLKPANLRLNRPYPKVWLLADWAQTHVPRSCPIVR